MDAVPLAHSVSSAPGDTLEDVHGRRHIRDVEAPNEDMALVVGIGKIVQRDLSVAKRHVCSERDDTLVQPYRTFAYAHAAHR